MEAQHNAHLVSGETHCYEKCLPAGQAGIFSGPASGGIMLFLAMDVSGVATVEFFCNGFQPVA